MRTAAPWFLLVSMGFGLAAPAWAQAQGEAADREYRALLQAWKAKKFTDALERATRFKARHPEHRFSAGVHYLGGTSAYEIRRWDRAAAFFEQLVRRHPLYKYAGTARRLLVVSLARSRRLDEAMAWCDRNLAVAPRGRYAPFYLYTKGSSLFRLYRFKEAAKVLAQVVKSHPGTRYAGQADGLLRRINPAWKVDANRVVQDYRGKYVDDVRFRRQVARIPELIAGARATFAALLGVERDVPIPFLIRFRDNGFDNNKGLRANSSTWCWQGGPCTVITLYTEYVVLGREEFGLRLTHELNHALARGVLGQAYLSWPKWLREGLAIHCAGQLDDRIDQILGSRVFSGNDPYKVLDGLLDRNHNFLDYLEDGCAFAWLAARKPDSLRRFWQRVVAGAKGEEAFFAAGGVPREKAVAAIEALARTRVEKALEPGYKSFLAIRNQDYRKRAEGAQAHGVWAVKEGLAAYTAWLARHPRHVLTANAHYRHGRVLMSLARYGEARRSFLKVMAIPLARSAEVDDAAYWYARSYELEGDKKRAAGAFGILLRDYCWSIPGRKVKGKYPPAGPVVE